MLKNNLTPNDTAINYDFSRPDDIRKRSRRVYRVQSGEKVLFQYCSLGCACTARGGRNCRFQKIIRFLKLTALLWILLIIHEPACMHAAAMVRKLALKIAIMSVLKKYSCNGRAACTTRTRHACRPHPNHMPPIVNQRRWVVSHGRLAVSWPFLSHV